MTKNYLTDAKKFQLRDYMAQHLKEYEEQNASYEQVARSCGAALGFTLTSDNIAGLAKSSNLTWKKTRQPTTPLSSKVSGLEEKLNRVVDDLRQLNIMVRQLRFINQTSRES